MAELGRMVDLIVKSAVKDALDSISPPGVYQYLCP
jgi:hypothetical protein